MPRPRFFQLNSVGRYHRPAGWPSVYQRGSSGNTISLNTEILSREPYTILYRKSAQRCNFKRLQLSGMKLWIFEPQFQALSVSDCHSLFQQVYQCINKNHIYRAMWEFEHQWYPMIWYERNIHTLSTCTFFWGGGLRISPSATFSSKTPRQWSMCRFPCRLKGSFDVIIPGEAAKLVQAAKLRISVSWNYVAP